MLFLLSHALAQNITVTIDEDLARQAGVDPAEIEDQMSTLGDGALKISEQQDFLREMANASALVTKGMGVDYASNPQSFVFGGSFGTSVSGVGASFVRGEQTLPEGGYAVQVSGMAGLNLGFTATEDSFARRIVLYVNGMALKGASGEFDANFYNAGAHLQLKLIRPPHKGIVEWGGLDLTGGYELSRYYLELGKTLNIASDPVRWEATGTANIEAMTTTIPIELSTNLRVFVVTAFAGAGLDIRQGGRAGSSIALGGPLYVEVNGQEQQLGTVEANVDMSGAPDYLAPRVFGGAQVNILFLKVYGQVNYGVLDESFGGHIGLRVAI